MKNKSTIYNLILFILSVLTLTASPFAFANEINLYDQPKAAAKIVGKIDPAVGIVPIFTPKEGDWMKVGDPRNGNVGWIKSDELNTGSGPSVITFTQKITNEGKTPYSSQVIQYGQPPKLTNEQMQAVQKMQMQQQAVQQSMQKALQNLMQDMSTLYKHQMDIFQNFPMIMPVVIMPQPTATTAPANQPGTKPQSTPVKANIQPAAH